MTDVTLQSIYEARRAIQGVACRTPLVPAHRLGGDELDLRLKLETAQPTGAFKLRGAANAAARLSAEALRRGVVCASTGNHGRAVAYAARRLGGRAVVCMSSLVPQNKLDAIRALGAETRIVGESQDEAQVEVERLVAEDGLSEIPPFDHPDVIAGQGTIGLELLEDFPDLDTVVVPLSGGGLIAGIARAVKSASPAIRVIGVSTQRGAAMHASLEAGRPVEVREEPTLADSLGGGIGLANRWTFAMVRDLVDDTVLVSEAEIAAAMRRLFLEESWVAEGGGAVGVALLQDRHRARLGRRVAMVISGRGIDMAMFRRVVDGEVPFGTAIGASYD
ncbi:hydroxyectoine utilization dehydratase EutB [Thalassobaculum fulvum]|uniref:Hydroxyectoine utilization dehydratase EutB n=1 Tax=Thalassobaculum fulvum TaxID=1633335 RepID=A0A919CQ52_9PROT|nr:hydroxyectoine utilization dehydratase EutB [Thalassobaculum fulvum]GHD52670.1 hydroxyectoine utilization dehydratase EutB [Thalassobaculum fulvum]